jgi:hypothetical protein
MKEAGKIDPKAQENQSRRIGLEQKLKEKVVDAKEDKTCHQKAKDALFATTGEPSLAPNHDDAARERVISGSHKDKKPVLAVQQEQASTKGHHSGRPHPPSCSAGGEDFAEGASNGGELNAQNAVRK